MIRRSLLKGLAALLTVAAIPRPAPVELPRITFTLRAGSGFRCGSWLTSCE